MKASSTILLIYSAILGLAAAGMSSCSGVSEIAASTSMYTRDTSGGLYDIMPVRGAIRPLRLHRDGEEFECTDCHDGFVGDKAEEALKGEHKEIAFDHGLNLLCLNCHNPKNSMAYVYHDGSEIPSSEPTRLCAKCHGPVYREWMLGVHGRKNEFWNSDFGEPKPLDCIQCHNPHHPKFEPLAPEPPPALTRFDLATQGGSPDGR